MVFIYLLFCIEFRHILCVCVRVLFTSREKVSKISFKRPLQPILIENRVQLVLLGESFSVSSVGILHTSFQKDNGQLWNYNKRMINYSKEV